MSKKKMAGSFCSPWLSRTRMYALLLLFFFFVYFLKNKIFIFVCAEKHTFGRN